MKFRIKYAMSGGFGGLDNTDWEEIDAHSLQEATNYAEEMAKDIFEMYAGMYGVQSWEDISEENPGSPDEDIDELYYAEIDSWIDYAAEKI